MALDPSLLRLPVSNQQFWKAFSWI